MKNKIVLYLIGLVIIAIVAGLIWLLAWVMQRELVTSGFLGVVLIVLIFALGYGVLWLGGKGWDTNNPFIEHYKVVFVFLALLVPFLNLIIPYWVGLGFARLTGLDASIELATLDNRDRTTRIKRGRGTQNDPLEMLLSVMADSTSEALESKDYPKTVDSATSNIQLCEDQVKEKPNLAPIFHRYLVEFYSLRAQARYALHEQTGDTEQMDLGRQDAEQARSLFQDLSGTLDRASLQALEAQIARIPLFPAS